MRKLFLMIIICLILPTLAWGTTRTMSACTEAAFDAAYSVAISGDTIAFPAGTCNITSWTSKTIAKTNLTIQGSGITNTSITTAGAVFYTDQESANGLRITGIRFNGQTQAFYFDSTTAAPKQALKNFRIDHCYFDSSYVFLETDGEARGVIDNNTFYNCYGARIYGIDDPASPFPAVPFTMGTANSVFFEDNIITVEGSASPAHFIAANTGARYVFRYNTYSQDHDWGWPDILDAHDNYEIGTRGTFTTEIYNNTFTLTGIISDKRAIHFRGGQHLVYNNTATVNGGYIFELSLNSYMCCSGGGDCTWPAGDQITATYIWGNTGITISNDCSTVIQQGRDYFLYAMPGYTAYEYPHPLRGEGGDTTPPTVTSVSVNGSTVTVNFSETVVTTGYDTGDFNLDCTNPTLTNVSLSSPSGSGDSRTFTSATIIGYGQTCNLDYVGSTDDIEDEAGNDLATFNDTAVTNNTPEPPSATGCTIQGVNYPK